MKPRDRDIVSILEPFLLKERIKTIDKVLENRVSSIVLVLENIHDVHNISAILRSAEALGIQRVTISGEDLKINRDVSINAEIWLTIERINSIKGLPSLLPKVKVFATDLKSDSMPINKIDFTSPCAIVLGNEHDGISDECRAIADERFYLPLRGFTKSLNVSVAGGIILSEVIRYQKKKQILAGLDDESKESLRAFWYKQTVKNSDSIIERYRSKMVL